MLTSNKKPFIACIVEGSAELAIIEILFENDLLIFDGDNVLDVLKPIMYGSEYKNFVNFERYILTRNLDGRKLIVYYINDSKKISENIKKKLAKAMPEAEFQAVLTRPEIEILHIISVGHYSDYVKKYKNNGRKPSEYVKSELGIKNIKSYEFVKKHFSDVKLLVSTITKARQYSNDEFTIFDLLKR